MICFIWESTNFYTGVLQRLKSEAKTIARVRREAFVDYMLRKTTRCMGWQVNPGFVTVEQMSRGEIVSIMALLGGTGRPISSSGSQCPKLLKIVQDIIYSFLKFSFNFHILRKINKILNLAYFKVTKLHHNSPPISRAGSEP